MIEETTPIDTASTQERDLLAAAIVRRDKFAEQVKASRDTLDRATALVQSLTSEVKQHDAAIVVNELKSAEALAAQLRQGVALLSVDSPADVGNDERRTLQSHLNAATHARDQIQSETKNLEGTLAHAAAVVRRHALVILRFEAEKIANEILQQEKDLWAQRTLLRGIAFAEYKLAAMDATRGALDKPTLLTMQSTRALQPAAEPQHAGSFDPAKDTALNWQAFYNALTEDAQARFFN
jgi:NADH dehydrogenase/NADH:ubiquinone oxidoreductase subunit G